MLSLATVLLALATGASPRDTLTLEQALARALRERPQLRVANAVTAEARARLGLAGQFPNPTLQFKHTESTAAEEAILQQPLDWLLTRGSERGAARAGVRGSEADSTRIRAAVVREVRVTFFRALAAAEVERVATALGAAADSLAGFAAERVAAGDLSVLERDQFGVEAGRVRQLLSRAREASEAARAALGRSVGDGGDHRPVGALQQGLEGPWPERPAEGVLPMVRRAVADSASAQALARAAGLRRFPVPSLLFGREWENEGPFSSGALGILGFSVPVPLWNVGGGAVAAARARADGATAAAGETRLEAARLLAEGESRLRATRERALLSRDSLLPRAERLSSGAVRLYRAGQTGVLPLFDALRAEREIALGYVEDLLAWQVALADWLLLLGRSE